MEINNNNLNVNIFLETKKDTTLIFTHGLGEYSKSYKETATFFNEKGFNVITYDIRGHGKSDGKRGSVNSYKDFIKDLDELVKLAYKKTKYVFLIGHSMGGIITNIYTSLNNNVDGVIITASPTTYLTNMRLLKYFPRFLINNRKFPTNFNDPKLVHENNYIVDEFDLESFRFKLVNEVMFKGMKVLINNYNNYKTPVLLIYSKKDKLAPIHYGELFYKEISSKDKELFILNESFHNVFNDIEKEKVWEKILSWLNLKLNKQNN